jgi:tetratricopeptide (TPR) repeat protein
MKLVPGVLLTAGAALLLGACAPAATGTGGPGGPRQTEFSRRAQIALVQAAAAEGAEAQQRYRAALEAAQAGLQADDQNALHHYLAGEAYAGLGQFEEADRHLTRAVELHPGLDEDVLITREGAWVMAFNEGVQHHTDGDPAGAVRAWERANRIYDRRPEAYLNLAAVATQQAEYDRAIAAYQQGLAALDRRPAGEQTAEILEEREQARRNIQMSLGQLLLYTERFADAERLYRSFLDRNPGDVAAQASLAVALANLDRRDEALQMYDRLMTNPQSTPEDIFAVGVGLFQIEDYTRAATAFRRVTEVWPNSRDAWYNLLNSLYAAGQHQQLIPVAERVLQIDPLNPDVYLILGGAFRETRQNERALDAFQQHSRLPVAVSGLQIRSTERAATVNGVVTGLNAREGTPLQLEFTFYGADGPLGTRTVTVAAPRPEASTPLEVTFESSVPVVGYSYALRR